MNPLKNGNTPTNQLSPQMMQNIKQVKGMMQMMNGDPTALMQQNPMIGQVMQMCKGRDPQQIFMNMCKQRGFDPNVILNELQN